MSINLASEEQQTTLTSSSGNTIEKVDDFTYLGSSKASSKYDFKLIKAKAQASCHKMKKIWTTIHSYGRVYSTIWFGDMSYITKSLSNKIDGCQTRMLRTVLDIDWRVYKTNKEVYRNFPRASLLKIQERRMKLTGHLERHYLIAEYI